MQKVFSWRKSMKDKVLVAGVEISNPNKTLFPKSKINKIDVVQYYEKIAPLILPHLSNRLLSVVRCHENIESEKFFKKHPTTEKEFVKTVYVGEDEYFYISNLKELVFQAQMGTLEFHTWGSTVKNLDKPDVMVFDLDPSEDVSLEKLRDGVRLVKDVLDGLKLKSYLKTSGGKGYHIVVPFSNSKGWDFFGEFSRDVALLLEAKHPNMFTSNIRKEQRQGRIFVDYLRNKKGATCVAAYSVRARENAPISFPISWKELDKISPNEVTISNFDKYLSKQNSWKDFAQEKQVLK